MHSRILSVDDNAVHLRLIEESLIGEEFQVVSSQNGRDAERIVHSIRPDAVIADLMMPQINGIQLCRNLKRESATRHIPVLIVTAVHDRDMMLKALDSGADDFLQKPVDPAALKCRLRNLVWTKRILDELREQTPPGANAVDTTELLDADTTDQPAALAAISEHAADFDLVVVGVDGCHPALLDLILELRQGEVHPGIPILVVARTGDSKTVRETIERGANDFIYNPFESHELLLRSHALVRRWRSQLLLRNSAKRLRDVASRDALTGAFNRHLLDTMSARLVEDALNKANDLSIVLLDIDHFKRINDTYGHDAGDAVLKRFTELVQRQLRTSDAFFRLGGEEFVAVLPGADGAVAFSVAERLRLSIETTPFSLPDGREIRVTSSLGIAVLGGLDDSMQQLVKRADQALYRAKKAGRNQTIVAPAEPLAPEMTAA
ncbi:MAG TPA: diguanylate cyclase [Aestuariivirgaceae bacterium]|jgi:two-component system, cell cycle response regulator|nr:diguanylate cyclase [Aestuariivirgaceae bacterium]